MISLKTVYDKGYNNGLLTLWGKYKYSNEPDEVSSASFICLFGSDGAWGRVFQYKLLV